MGCIALVMWASADAAAQPAQPANGASERHARTLYARGLKHYNVAEYAEAISLFKRAYKIHEAPGFLYNIAQAYRLAGDCTQAARFYGTYLRVDPGASNRDKARQQIADMRACEEAGQSRSLGVASPDAEPVETQPVETQPVETQPVETQPVETQPAKTDPMDPRSKDPVESTAPTPTATSRDVASAGARSGLRTTGLVTLAAGVALAGTAGVYGLQAADASEKLDTLYREGGQFTPAFAAIESDGKRSNQRALLFGIAGGVAIVGGTVLFLLGRRGSRVRPSVSLAPGFAGGTLAWSWK